MATRRMTDEKRNAEVPDKPTGIAPGDVDYPGKQPSGKNSKDDAAETGIDPLPQGGRGPARKTGPKGTNMKSATQDG